RRLPPIAERTPRRDPASLRRSRTPCDPCDSLYDLIASQRHHAHQFRVSFFCHCERWTDLRILLGLDHEPALIAMGGQPSDDGGEVERAVARHREGARYDGVKKALSAAV